MARYGSESGVLLSPGSEVFASGSLTDRSAQRAAVGESDSSDSASDHMDVLHRGMYLMAARSRPRTGGSSDSLDHQENGRHFDDDDADEDDEEEEQFKPLGSTLPTVQYGTLDPRKAVRGRRKRASQKICVKSCWIPSFLSVLFFLVLLGFVLWYLLFRDLQIYVEIIYVTSSPSSPEDNFFSFDVRVVLDNHNVRSSSVYIKRLGSYIRVFILFPIVLSQFAACTHNLILPVLFRGNPTDWTLYLSLCIHPFLSGGNLSLSLSHVRYMYLCAFVAVLCPRGVQVISTARRYLTLRLQTLRTTLGSLSRKPSPQRW